MIGISSSAIQSGRDLNPPVFTLNFSEIPHREAVKRLVQFRVINSDDHMKRISMITEFTFWC